MVEGLYIDMFNGSTLEEAIKKLENLKEKHENKYDVLEFGIIRAFDPQYEDDELILYGTRKETAAEKKKRLAERKKLIAKNKKKEEKILERERKKYEKLKKKFEKE